MSLGSEESEYLRTPLGVAFYTIGGRSLAPMVTRMTNFWPGSPRLARIQLDGAR
jgi:hypothetical protein